MRNVYDEAVRGGHVVRLADASGAPLAAPWEPVMIDAPAVMLDASSPRSRAWYRALLAEEVLGESGANATGFMADYGEWLPRRPTFRSATARTPWRGTTPTRRRAGLHRGAVEDDARAARRAGSGSRDGRAVLRTGTARSPGDVCSLQLGDQTVTWDAHDGLASAVAGLSSGLSGLALTHSDTGGFAGMGARLRPRREKPSRGPPRGHGPPTGGGDRRVAVAGL